MLIKNVKKIICEEREEKPNLFLKHSLFYNWKNKSKACHAKEAFIRDYKDASIYFDQVQLGEKTKGRMMAQLYESNAVEVTIPKTH